MTGVDVIVPCFNYGRYLESCTRSVLRHTTTPLRVLVIDDASTDGSGEVAAAIARADGRVTVRRHDVNRGHIATFNEGLAWASSDYLLLLSADDMVAPGALARAVALMKRRPEVALTYGRAVRFASGDQLPDADDGAAGSEVVSGRDFIRSLCAVPVNPVETATAVVRTRVQKAVGGYRPELPHSGDLEMWLRFAARGAVGVIAADQGFVRLHGSNMRDGYRGSRLLHDFAQRDAAFRSFFSEHGAAVDPTGRWASLARRRLAREVVAEGSRALDNGRPHAGLVQLAAEIDPAVRLTPSYLKLAAKRMVRKDDGRGGRAAPPAPCSAGGRSLPRIGDDARVSLIVTTRDRGDFLAPFLARLEALSTPRSWELVIVDNGSADETWGILNAFAARAPAPVRLLREPAPGRRSRLRTAAFARNVGVRAARGDILCFTDDDCYLPPDFIEAVVKVFKENDVGLIGGRVLLYDPMDDPVCVTSRTASTVFGSGSLPSTGEIQGACMAFRREVLADTGLFDPAFGAGAPLKGAEDSELVARASLAGWSSGFFTEPFVHHHHRRRARGAARVTAGYDFSRGAYFAKLWLRHPARRWLILKHWYWDTPVMWRPSRRAFVKFGRELRGACRYLVSFSRSREARLA